MEDRNEKGVFIKGHILSEEIRNKIADTLDRTGDLTNKRFGLWVALEKRGIRSGARYWLCRCDCGIEKEVAQRSLVNGKSTKCKLCGARLAGSRRRKEKPIKPTRPPGRPKGIPLTEEQKNKLRLIRLGVARNETGKVLTPKEKK